MNKFLIPALGLAAALAFSVPTFQVTPAGATTTVMHKKVMHKKTCKPSKTHKCPVVHHKKKNVHHKKKKTTY